MITIGFRALPREVVFAVYDSKKNIVLNVDKIKLPLSMRWPESLKLLRSGVLDVLREYDVNSAGVRVTESSARSVSTSRIEIEGVLKESFASSNLKKYYVGEISSISSRVGIERSKFKKILDADSFKNIDGWNSFSKEEKEAIICSVGAVNA